MNVAVIGAGLAGLAAAHELARRGHKVRVYERGPQVGGLARSWRSGRFWLDLGPHRFHTRDAELEQHVTRILDGEVVRRERLSRIHLRGRFFQYPLQFGNVVANLEPRLIARSFSDYLRARLREGLRPTPDASFEAWVKKRFGRTLYELFFEAYTEKAWGMPCDQISADWASQRISQANLLDAVMKTLRPPQHGEVRSLVSEFIYPRRGGIGELSRCYAAKLTALGGEVRLGTAVTGLRPARGGGLSLELRSRGGLERSPADRVLNTMPLPRLVGALGDEVPRVAHEAARGLSHVSIVFVYLEVARPRVSPDHWIYLPERHLRVHRVSEFKNFSDATAPGESTVICCEITCRFGDATWRLSREELLRVARADLSACGLLREGEGRLLDVARARHAYPVYDLDYRPRLETLRGAVRGVRDLITTGRQGLFRYNNMDHSIAMGRHAARRIDRAERAAEPELGASYLG